MDVSLSVARAAKALRIASGLVLLAALAACGGGGSAPAEPGPLLAARNYLPLAVGDRWVYRDTATFEATLVHVVAPAVVDGRSGVRVASAGYPTIDALEPTSTGELLYVVQGDGILQAPTPLSSPQTRAIGPIRLLPLPLRAGDSFVQFETTIDSGIDVDADGRTDPIAMRAVVTVVGLEPVTVPAGTFADCLHLQTVINQRVTATASGRTLDLVTTDDEWLAPDVGAVRSVIAVRSGTLTQSSTNELVAYGVGGRRSESTPPVVVEPPPLADASGVPPPFVGLKLSERVAPDSAQAAFRLIDAQGRERSGRVVQSSDGTLQFFPDVRLDTGRFEARVSGSLVDLAGNPLGADVVWHFVVDADAPRVVSITPTDQATGVPIDSRITLRFSEAIRPSSVGARLVEEGATGPFAREARVSVDGDTVTLVPTLPLRRGVRYTVEVDASTSDLLFNPMAAPFRASFVADPGRFAPPEMLMTNTTGTAVGDVDGDGRADLVALVPTPAQGVWAYGVFVRYGQADGTLGAATDTGWRGGATFSCLGIGPVIGDLNGDGRLDVVIADGTCGTQVLLQGSDGRLRAGPLLAPTGTPRIVDLDGDGRMDLVGLAESNAFQFWRQSAAGVLVAQPDVATGIVELLEGGFEFADVNGDGRADLVIGTRVNGQFSVQQLVVAHQRANGSFAPDTVIAMPVNQLATGDIDGDGRTDIAVISADNVQGGGTLAVLLQRADGTLAPTRTFGLENSPQRVRLADIDRDGRRDAVVWHDSFGTGYLLQQPDGGFAAEQMYAQVFFGGGSSLSVADLDGDGRPDIVAGGAWLRQLPTASPLSAPRRTALSGIGAAMLAAGRSLAHGR